MIFISCYALVIGNQAPPPPQKKKKKKQKKKKQVRAADSRGNERGFHQSFATAVQGKYPGYALYRHKGQ